MADSSASDSRGLQFGDLQRALFLGLAMYLGVRFASAVALVLLYFLLVFILAAAFNPLVVWLAKRRISRPYGSLLIGFGGLLILGVIAAFGLAPVLDQGKELAALAPDWMERVSHWLEDQRLAHPDLLAQVPTVDELRQNLIPQMRLLLGPLGHYTLTAVGGIVSVLLLGVLVLFTLANPAPLVAGLLGLVPTNARQATERALRRSLVQLRRWALGSLTLGLIVGMMSYIGLKLLGIPSALLFAVIAGVGEMIPTLGPVLSALPPLLVALTLSPGSAAGVLVLYIAIQQVENNLIVPLILGESLELHPVSIIFMVVVMAALFGLLGAIMAVPVTTILKCGYEEFYLRPRHPQPGALREQARDIVNNPSGGPTAKNPSESRPNGAAD